MAQTYLLIEILTEVPWLIVMLIGGILSLSRYQSNPARYGKILIAIGLAVGGTYGGRVLTSFAWPIIYPLVGDPSGNRRMLLVASILLGIPSSLAYSLAWAFLFGAAFGKGSAPRSRYLIEDRS